MQLVRNAGWGGLSAAFRAGYGLLNILLAIRLLGADSYGHFAAVSALFVFFVSVSTSMFTVLVVKLMSALVTDQEKKLLLASGVVWVGISLAFLTVVGATSWVLAYGSKPPAEWQIDSQNLNLILVLCLQSTAQIASAYQLAMMESAGRLDLGIKTQFVGPFLVIAVLLAALLVPFQFSILIYALVLCVGAGVDLFLAWIFRRSLARLEVRDAAWRDVIAKLRELLKSGGLLQATVLMNMFLEPFNKALLNSVVGGAAVAIYDLAMKVIWGILSVFSAAMRVFLHLSSQERQRVESSYLDFVKLFCIPTVLLHVVACLVLVGAGRYWLNLDTPQLALFFAIATLSNLGMIAVMPLYNSLVGAEEMRFLFKAQVTLAIVNVVSSLLVVPILGVVGAAFGLLLATAYNATAIVRKAETTMNTAELFERLRLNGTRRLAFAVLLFGLSVYCGLDGRVAIPLGIAVLIVALIMSAQEPLAGHLFAALKLRRFPQS